MITIVLARPLTRAEAATEHYTLTLQDDHGSFLQGTLKELPSPPQGPPRPVWETGSAARGARTTPNRTSRR